MNFRALFEICNPLRHWHLSHIENCHVNEKNSFWPPMNFRALFEIYNPLRNWHLSHIEDCHVNETNSFWPPMNFRALFGSSKNYSKFNKFVYSTWPGPQFKIQTQIILDLGSMRARETS
jgi:hypothetical protein